MMDSCQEVLQSMGARLDFEPIYFSEVRKFERSRMTFYILQINHGASKSIDEVMASVTKNKVCLKGVIGIPEVRTWSNIVQQYSYIKKF